MAFNELLLAPPSVLTLPESIVTFTVASAANADGSIDITLHATATALYATLTTLAYGRFSDNAFALAAGNTTVQFVPFGKLDEPTLRKSLRIEHLKQAL